MQDACEHSLLDSTAGHPHSLRKRWLRPLGLIGLALCLRCRNGEAPHCPLVHRFLGKMSWPHPFVSKMRLLRSMSSYLKKKSHPIAKRSLDDIPFCSVRLDKTRPHGGLGHLRAPLSLETPSQDSPTTALRPSLCPLMLKIAKSMRFNIQGEDSLQRHRQSTWCFLNGIDCLTPEREL